MHAAPWRSLPGQVGVNGSIAPQHELLQRRTRGRAATLRVSSSSQSDTERRTPLSAPPVRIPPPPPPPPPPQRTSILSRRAILGILLGGSGLGWAMTRRNGPEYFQDTEGRVFVKTPGGHMAAINMDSQGHMNMLDTAGNYYFDTGDSQAGWYIVDPQANLYNVFEDQTGAVQRTFVGNLKDLREADVTSIAGVPIEQIREGYEKQFKEELPPLIGFPETGEPRELPPNIPMQPSKDGTMMEGPPMIVEGSVELEPVEEDKSWFPSFGGNKSSRAKQGTD